jgi:hypothetical protein
MQNNENNRIGVIGGISIGAALRLIRRKCQLVESRQWLQLNVAAAKAESWRLAAYCGGDRLRRMKA